MSSHRADLAEMGSVVSSLVARSRDLEALADRLARQLDTLSPWSGLAATAHDDARVPWDAGFATMRAALADMREVVAHAREQYAAAADHNVGLWEELS
ncbi:hypothetical protein GCM10009623_26890 [Nocardioides aestuarii]|uniref:WXG100 family type VII secretion target n=1 Tax=Nocardioides aestuarii TaxID=252231 RepID=A0ABW4TPG2_9ACTN